MCIERAPVRAFMARAAIIGRHSGGERVQQPGSQQHAGRVAHACFMLAIIACDSKWGKADAAPIALDAGDRSAVDHYPIRSPRVCRALTRSAADRAHSGATPARGNSPATAGRIASLRKLPTQY